MRFLLLFPLFLLISLLLYPERPWGGGDFSDGVMWWSFCLSLRSFGTDNGGMFPHVNFLSSVF
jgi:hypothetical protein